MELHIEQRPEVAQWVAQCFASMVAASPNYTEMKFDVVARGSKWEWLTVLIQKGNGKTPHQLRTEAEQETARLKALLDARSHGTGAEAPNDPSSVSGALKQEPATARSEASAGSMQRMVRRGREFQDRPKI